MALLSSNNCYKFFNPLLSLQINLSFNDAGVTESEDLESTAFSPLVLTPRFMKIKQVGQK
jgi:hypothetical protein